MPLVSEPSTENLIPVFFFKQVSFILYVCFLKAQCESLYDTCRDGALQNLHLPWHALTGVSNQVAQCCHLQGSHSKILEGA